VGEGSSHSFGQLRTHFSPSKSFEKSISASVKAWDSGFMLWAEVLGLVERTSATAVHTTATLCSAGAELRRIFRSLNQVLWIQDSDNNLPTGWVAARHVSASEQRPRAPGDPRERVSGIQLNQTHAVINERSLDVLHVRMCGLREGALRWTAT
jgi:hypothetical protein